MAAAPSLAELLEQSRRLTANIAQSDIPSLELALDQIESASRKLGSRPAAASDEGAHYLLAHGDVDFPMVSRVLNNLDPVAAFAPLQPLNDTDIQGYLRHSHEQTIISAIEESRRATVADFYADIDRSVRKDWEKIKEKLFEELQRSSASTSTPALAMSTSASRRKLTASRGMDVDNEFSARQPASSGSTLQMHSKMMRYDQAIRKINQYRRDATPVGVINLLSDACNNTSNQGEKSAQLAETYKLLAHLVRENDVIAGEFQRTAINERQYAKAYLDADPFSTDGSDVRRMIADGARTFLEEQFMQHVEKTVAAKAAEAKLGGVPSIANKIRAYVHLKFTKMGKWIPAADNLEMVNQTPIWARIYYLLRAGYPNEALEFAIENERYLQNLEKGFLPYFKAWLDSPDRRLPKQLRDRFLSEYNQRHRYVTPNSGDPFKHALYKLLGRTELTRRSIPTVTATTEDWLWLQLMLVRENTSSGDADAAHERFGLQDLAKVLVGFGENHFDPKGNRPLLYFQVLLLCGQFERAVAYLYANSQYQVDAVHLAIALAYYGLIRVPSQAGSMSDIDLLSTTTVNTQEVQQLNFARLMYRYYRSFAASDPIEAFQYSLLIALNADAPNGVGKQQLKLAQDAVRELVMETKAYTELLGDIRNDGTKMPGQIEKDMKLLHLPDSKSYLNAIVKAAAQRADSEKRFSDTILLYNLAEEYDLVLSTLNTALGDSLSQPSSITGDIDMSGAAPVKSTGFGAAEDLVGTAKSILEHYERSSMIAHRLSKKNRETCATLMKLKDCITLYEQNRLEDALLEIENVNLIPLSGDLVVIIRKAEEVKELDEAIVRNFDIVLLTAMNILYKLHSTLKESQFGDASRQNKMTELRKKARALMMFAGMLRFRLSAATYSHLTRLDVFLH